MLSRLASFRGVCTQAEFLAIGVSALLLIAILQLSETPNFVIFGGSLAAIWFLLAAATRRSAALRWFELSPIVAFVVGLGAISVASEIRNSINSQIRYEAYDGLSSFDQIGMAVGNLFALASYCVALAAILFFVYLASVRDKVEQE